MQIIEGDLLRQPIRACPPNHMREAAGTAAFHRGDFPFDRELRSIENGSGNFAPASMTFLPLIERELRTQSRQSANYWLRWVGVAFLIGAACWAWLEEPFRPQDGERVFQFLHGMTFLGIWMLVPILTADVLSRERREGTLDLLFLTPLRVRDVVAAKGLAHALKALSLCVAAAPVLMIPLLMGGVGWWQIGMSFTINATSLALTLSAGLLASSLNVTLHRALAWAYLWSILGFCIWMIGMASCINHAFLPASNYPWTVKMALAWNGIIDAAWLEEFLRRRRGHLFWTEAMWSWSLILGAGVCISLMFFLAAVIGLRWRRLQTAPSRRREQAERILFSPKLAPVLYERWMRWKLERNPIGWLEQRTWQARLVTWSWLAMLVSVYGFLMSGAADWILRSYFHAMQGMLAKLLLLSMAFTAAGSFRRERENGVMELLLVSPLRSRDLVIGRLRGLWNQFLPAFLMLAGVWLYLGATFVSRRYIPIGQASRVEISESLVQVAAAFWAVPVVGLYCSLRFRHYFLAVVVTACAIMFETLAWSIGLQLGKTLQIWAGTGGVGGASFRYWHYAPALAVILYWGMLAIWLKRRLVRHLQRRQHVLPQ